MVEERWKALGGNDMETSVYGCSLVSSTESRAVLVICDGPLNLSLASTSSASLHSHSFGLVESLGPGALALHVIALVRLMMNLLSVRGLRDVSLSSCLFSN